MLPVIKVTCYKYIKVWKLIIIKHCYRCNQCYWLQIERNKSQDQFLAIYEFVHDDSDTCRENFTNLSSREVAPASSEFSISSLTTLKTDVITWELPSKRTVSFGSSWSNRFGSVISKVEFARLCKPKVS